MVDAEVTKEVMKQIEEEIANEPTSDELEEHYQDQPADKESAGEMVMEDTIFTRKNGTQKQGFYMNGFLKDNFDEYLIKAVAKKWDGVGLITGMEGSGKSTATMGYAKYVDPTFPGKPLNDGTTRRSCDRIVFSTPDLMKAIDSSKPGQAIVFDEAVMGLMAGDASTELQKTLIKKMVTIRKKRLFIFIVIPSIFLLRKYMAIFRSRYLIHFYTPDGLTRGQFKFYSYDTKRKLYIKGLKEFDQDAVKSDFVGNAVDLEGYFFNIDEYEKKKDDAIKKITEPAPEEAKAGNQKKANIIKYALAWKLFTVYKAKFGFSLTDFTKRVIQDEMNLDVQYKTIREYMENYKNYLAFLEKEALDRHTAEKLNARDIKNIN